MYICHFLDHLTVSDSKTLGFLHQRQPTGLPRVDFSGGMLCVLSLLSLAEKLDLRSVFG